MIKIKKFDFKIGCPVFLHHKEDIERLTRIIESHGISEKKVDPAHELLGITEILLVCSSYDEQNEDCENCHFILNLRRETARMIINANGIMNEHGHPLGDRFGLFSRIDP